MFVTQVTVCYVGNNVSNVGNSVSYVGKLLVMYTKMLDMLAVMLVMSVIMSFMLEVGVPSNGVSKIMNRSKLEVNQCDVQNIFRTYMKEDSMGCQISSPIEKSQTIYCIKYFILYTKLAQLLIELGLQTVKPSSPSTEELHDPTEEANSDLFI